MSSKSYLKTIKKCAKSLTKSIPKDAKVSSSQMIDIIITIILLHKSTQSDKKALGFDQFKAET